MQTPSIFGFHFAFDKDFWEKLALQVVSVAAIAALTAGLDALQKALAANPSYALEAAIVALVAAAISRRVKSAT